MELWIFSDRQLNSVADWQAAVNAEGYPLQLSADMVFEQIKGFFPMQLRGKSTGFECYHDDPAEFMQTYRHVQFDRTWKYALGLRWQGWNVNELRAAWMAATAYAQSTGGVIVDDQELRIHTPVQARDVVSEVEHDFL
jgi:hypothetical protein